MKIFVSVDLEGIWGIVSKDHVSNQTKEYDRVRKIMTQEANWVIEKAFNKGATEVIVNDSHDTMDNLLIDKLHPKAQLISGSPKPLSMMEGIDDTFDGAIYIGYHARKGTNNGNFDHTYSGGTISSIKINGKPVGESGINAGVCGYYDVPILAISGDDKLAAQVKEEIGDVETIIVKKAISRYCSRNLSLESVKKEYKEKLNKAFDNINKYPTVKYKGNIEMEIEFTLANMAEMAMLLPGVVRKNPTTIKINSKDYLELFKMFRACLILGGTGK
ncbi:MAG: peptidase M55 [Firmicutes bacterium]|nr:peptidase M55 [Bacillota bacterium]